MAKRLCFSIIVLSIFLSSVPSSEHSLNLDSPPAQTLTGPQLTLNITDWWNAPVAINRVTIGKREVLPGSSIAGTDDWSKHLSIEAINKSEKTISYIAYAIDFTVAGEDSLYRIRLQDGAYFAFPDALTDPGGLRVLKGKKHHMRFTDDAWRCQSAVVDKINERKARIVNVELFVESVRFTDDTLWSFGSRLKRNKATSVFENVDYRQLSKKKDQHSGNVAKGFVAKGAPLTSYQPAGCCIVVMTYTSGGSKPVTVNMSCSNCPPAHGGGICPAPVPIRQVNSLSGQGSSGIMQTGFTQC